MAHRKLPPGQVSGHRKFCRYVTFLLHQRAMGAARNGKKIPLSAGTERGQPGVKQNIKKKNHASYRFRAFSKRV
jgi:hypothetical protein